MADQNSTEQHPPGSTSTTRTCTGSRGLFFFPLSPWSPPANQQFCDFTGTETLHLFTLNSAHITVNRMGRRYSSLIFFVLSISLFQAASSASLSSTTTRSPTTSPTRSGTPSPSRFAISRTSTPTGSPTIASGSINWAQVRCFNHLICITGT